VYVVGELTVFWDEVLQLLEAGYSQVGDYLSLLP
jgi:hypothetical protein